MSLNLYIMKHNLVSTRIQIFDGQYWEASLVQQLLEEQGIPSFLLNDLMSGIEAPAVTSSGLNPVSVTIWSDDFETSKKIIEAYKSSTAAAAAGN